jgi:hypothetical protein
MTTLPKKAAGIDTSIFQRYQFPMLANGPLNPAFFLQVGQDEI